VAFLVVPEAAVAVAPLPADPVPDPVAAVEPVPVPVLVDPVLSPSSPQPAATSDVAKATASSAFHRVDEFLT
jgi:hypothetical protein